MPIEGVRNTRKMGLNWVSGFKNFYNPLYQTTKIMTKIRT